LLEVFERNTFSTLSSKKKGRMEIRIAATREELGAEAGRDVANVIRERLSAQAELRIIFAAAPSQGEMLEALVKEEGIDWARITAFHMDEYIGLPEGSPQRFGMWLRAMIFDRVPFKAVHLLEPSDDLDATCREYARELMAAPIDFVLLGIGANGHLAFNDPPADLNDPLAVKVVTLDEECRQQQVDDECFESLAEVPQEALTLTIPSLLRADRLFCCAPGASKSNAARSAVHDSISGDSPATALRLHPRCTLYLDRDSSSEL
jgi:glucosamine-6-phosphate deaminase